MDGRRSPGGDAFPFSFAINGCTEAIRSVLHETHDGGERVGVTFNCADCASKTTFFRLSLSARTFLLAACLGQSVQGLLELDPLRMPTTLLHGSASLVLDRRCVAQDLR